MNDQLYEFLTTFMLNFLGTNLATYLPETNLELKIGIKKEAGICSMHTNDLVETIFYLAGTCA